MSYDIIVRFPDKKTADDWCGQMSDGFGEGHCSFTPWLQKPGTKGDKNSHYEKIKENGLPVFFMNEIFDDF